jgi:hypothetical protein
MATRAHLTQDEYEASMSSRCWWYTHLDQPWAKAAQAVDSDAELCGIVAQERRLGQVPEWAREVVTQCIGNVPPCGHCTFPLPQLQVIDAIGSADAPAFFAGCYTLDPVRKAQLQDLCLCLDGWLAGAEAEDVARELAWRSPRAVDWAKACGDLWEVLAGRKEWQELMIRRVVHALRSDAKQCPWVNDRGDLFGRDEFLGGIRVEKRFSYVEWEVARYDAGLSPRFKNIFRRLEELWPDTLPSFKTMFDEWWPCAPKSLRFLERIIWVVGRGKLASGKNDWQSYLAEEVPGFLQCEDTYPSQDEAAGWWQEFTLALEAYCRREPTVGPVGRDVHRRLREPTDVKRWLVRLYRHKLRKLEESGEHFTRLVRADGSGRRGKGKLHMR